MKPPVVVRQFHDDWLLWTVYEDGIAEGSRDYSGRAVSLLWGEF